MTKKSTKKSTRKRNLALADFRRTEILAAALKVFGKKGFALAHMEEVAQEAGIAKGTLYLYFKNKEDIYAEAAAHTMTLLASLTEEYLAGVQGFQVRLAAFIGLRIEFWQKQRILYRMLLTVGREPQHRKQTHTMVQTVSHRLITLIEEGVASGEIPQQDLRPVALAILDMMRGTNERRMDGFARVSPSQEAEEITRIALAALGFKKKPFASRSRRTQA